VTLMPRNTVAEVLACFDDEFAEVASAFARGEYVLWLGSGISRDVVPGVPELLERMLESLRNRSDVADPTCRFRVALEEVLGIAGVPATTVDLTTAVSSWPNLNDIVGRLVDRYSDVLDVQVEGEPEDFLVWFGLDVPSTYGAPDLEPDVEHLCIAILMMEGVVRSAPTTNWDGLVEAALERLCGGVDRVLKVIVTAADFTAPDTQAELVKFHGCAVRSADDPAQYRDLLIARKTQISGWTTKPQNQMMKNHLENLYASRHAFFVGLSAQDANIHTVLNQAIQNLSRSWPTAPPAVVFAEQTLHHHHKLVLRVTYGGSYSSNASAIASSALLGAYAKPALLALVLFTLADKLCALIEHITELSLSGPDLERIREGIRGIRDKAGEKAHPDPRSFVAALISWLTLAMWVFRTGGVHDGAQYLPLSRAPIAQAAQDPDYPRAALGRFAIAIALLGRGLLNGDWTLEPGGVARPEDGVVCVRRGPRTSKIFVVRDARALSELERDGFIEVDDPEVVIAQAEAVRKPTTRSPRPRYGRTGKSGARQVDLETLCTSVGTADELFEVFVLASAL
jgi:hypothetical protein